MLTFKCPNLDRVIHGTWQQLVRFKGMKVLQNIEDCFDYPHQPWMAATQNTLSSSFTVECVTLSHLSSSRPCVRDHVCLSKTVEHRNKMLIITHYVRFSRNEGQCCQRPIVSFLKVDSHLYKYFLTAILCFRCVSPERACDIFHPNGL